ncbi:chemotaxis protein CheW [Rhizobium paknamense]|uniref:Purine-binding chemotaxis protein CheW n=1 Tax=Rhizobium paknamense TaxID=1206817 RepID=A0ABU0IGP4_9HYPH|nr:chemotaxis protein CheW [Rhizobium paknamense]MDQ0457331.1 purine-binding chemotaxis protein CheW [Rhizobium paknamense]
MNANIVKRDFHEVWGDQDDLSVLTFTLGAETFAIKATMVQEIIDLLPETLVPGARPFVSSVINFRGKVIPLADIRLAFGMMPAVATIDSRIIVAEIDMEGEPILVGIRTDRVYEVTSLTRAASEPPPAIGMRWRADFIDCLVKRGGEFIILPDLLAIFSHHTERAVLTAATSS